MVTIQDILNFKSRVATSIRNMIGKQSIKKVEVANRFDELADMIGDVASDNCALMFQIGSAANPTTDHFHFAYLTKEQASSLVSREVTYAVPAALDDSYIQNNFQGVAITTTEENGHTHTITVNFNPYTQKFFIHPDTIPPGHDAYVLLQDGSTGQPLPGTDVDKAYVDAQDQAEAEARHSADDNLQASIETINDNLANKVNILPGKQLSTEDYTTAEKEKLASLSNADVNKAYVDIADQLEVTARQTADTNLQGQVDAINNTLPNKVDKITGYQLSQENYTTSEKNKLSNLSEHFKGYYTTYANLSGAVNSGVTGDYAYVDAGTGSNAAMYIWDTNDNQWVVASASGVTPNATESAAGLVELATVAEALARTDDQRAMTALKTIALIIDEKKNVYYQIAPVSLNEVSFLMRAAGNVTAVTIAGATNAKLKIGTAGTYPTGVQTYPFAYAAGDRIFVKYTYLDLNNATCNIILTCRDN